MHVNSTTRSAAPNDSNANGSISSSGSMVRNTHKHLFSSASEGYKQSSSFSAKNGRVETSEISSQDVFSVKSFSPEFEKAYKKFQLVKNSAENMAHQEHLGWLSPAAEDALRDLNAVVENKCSPKKASAASRTAFDIKALNPDEESAWENIVQQLPSVYKNYLPASSPWRAVTSHEVQAALSEDSAMAAMLATAEGKVFLDGLVKTLNNKKQEMAPSDHGMAITLRFSECYGTTSHIALAGAWFDENNQLKISVCHQESVIIPNSDKPVTGVVYKKFDTSKDYPGGFSPAVESIKLAGPPSASVFPCPFPEAIVGATEEISGSDKKRLYGPTYTWNEKQLTQRLKAKNKNISDAEVGVEVQKLKEEHHNQTAETCFNVTHKVLGAMYGAEPREQELLPHLVRKTAGFANIKKGEFETLTISGKSITLDDVPKLGFGQQVAVFLEVGKKWGKSLPWDVPSQTTSVEVYPPKRPGPLLWNLPAGARGVKFNGSTAGLTLNGKPVRPSITYSVEEAKNMAFSGKFDATKNETFIAITSAPVGAAGHVGAKL